MRLDVYENRNPASRDRIPYLLDVQAEVFSSLGTRVVVPLAREQAASEQRLTRLMPLLEVKGERFIALTPQLAGVARRELGALVDNAAEARLEIVAALDFLMTGS